MIERMEVQGKPAYVIWLNDDMSAGDRHAPLAKVIWDDGGMALMRKAPERVKDFDPDEPRDPKGKWVFGQPVVRAPRDPLPSHGELETHQGLPVRETRADPKRIAASSAQLKRWKVKELTSVLHKSFGKGGEYFAREWAIAEPDGSYTSVRMRGDGKVNVGQPSTVGFYPDPKQETVRLSDH